VPSSCPLCPQLSSLLRLSVSSLPSFSAGPKALSYSSPMLQGPWGREGADHIPLHRAQGTRVLVHCKMGVSRSAATVLAYAMKQYGWGLEQALLHVQGLRPIVRPNPGFLRQLQTYQGILTARYGMGRQGG
jgi:hypothetical protein